MLDDDVAPKNTPSPGPSARRGADDPLADPEIIDLINSISTSSASLGGSGLRQRQFTANKGKGKVEASRKREEGYDSDVNAIPAEDMDEFVTEPDAPGMSEPWVHPGYEDIDETVTTRDSEQPSYGASSTSNGLPSLTNHFLSETIRGRLAHPVISQTSPQAAGSPTSPFDLMTAMDTFPIGNRLEELLQMFSTDDLAFGRAGRNNSQNVRPRGQPVIVSAGDLDTAVEDPPVKSPTNPFTVPPTPLAPVPPSTSAAASASTSTRINSRQTKMSNSPKSIHEALPALPETSAPQLLNQPATRTRNSRNLTEDEINARLDEDDGDMGFAIRPTPPSPSRPLPPIPNTQTITIPPSPARTSRPLTTPNPRHSVIIDRGDNRLTIYPDNYDDYGFHINPPGGSGARNTDDERGVYNPYSRTRATTPPWEAKRANTFPMNVDDDWGSALQTWQPLQPRRTQEEDSGSHAHRQSSAPAAFGSTASANARQSSVDDDRRFAMRLIEEERQMAMDQAVAMYLMETQNPIDDCSFDNLVAQALVDRHTLDLIEQLNAAQYAHEPAPALDVSLVPFPRTANLEPADKANARSTNPFDDPTDLSGDSSKGKGKSAQGTVDEATTQPLFSSNVNRGDATPTQSVSNTSQSAVSVFLQSSTSNTASKTVTPPLPPPVPTSNCGICFEEFQIVDNPRQASVTASSTSTVSGKGKAPVVAPEFGVVLPCSKDHGFCVECFTMYVKSKLQNGKASEGRGFPIRCPGCDQKRSQWEVDDELVETVLDEETLEFWRRQKLLLSLPGMIYCPSSRCSELLEAPEDLIAGAPSVMECPYCTCSMCSQCKSIWHPDLTCQENEALKEHEDKEIYIMAKTQNWRRCPKCSVIVEKNDGCHHMTCRCGFEFCWLCGKVYGAGGCGGNCGEWVRDPNVIALPRPGQPSNQSGSSRTHIEPSERRVPQFSVRRRAPQRRTGTMEMLISRYGPQRSGLPNIADPSWLPPWSRG